MGKKEKQLARLEKNPKAVGPDVLQTVLAAFGYRKVRQKGSHATYRDGQGNKFVVPFKRPNVKQHYVEEVIARLRTQLLEEEEDAGE